MHPRTPTLPVIAQQHPGAIILCALDSAHNIADGLCLLLHLNFHMHNDGPRSDIYNVNEFTNTKKKY